MTVAALLDRAAVPLDSARRTALRAARGRPELRALLTRRDPRIAVIGTVHAIVAFALAVSAPMVLFILGPVLLGVLHVAADVRYLVLRQTLPRWWQTTVWAFCTGLIGLRTLAEFGVLRGSLDRAEIAVTAAWAAIGLVTGSREGRSLGRLLIGVIAIGTATSAALQDPATARLFLAQAHNVVALVLWVLIFRRRTASLLVPLFVTFGGTALLASGALYQMTLNHGVVSAFGLHVLTAADWIAPGLRADYAVGLTCAYVFLQSIHYIVWLALVPQEVAAGTGLTTFRASARSLVRDFGGAGVGAIGLAAAAVLLGAVADVPRARNLYLSLAMFHAYLELALFAYFYGRGFRPDRGTA